MTAAHALPSELPRDLLAFREGYRKSEKQQHAVVTVKLDYIEWAQGDVIAGLILSQIMYWFGYGKDGKNKTTIIREGRRWLAKSYPEWFDECRVTEHPARDALKRLADLGLIEKHVWRFNGAPTTHVSLNELLILKLLRGDIDPAQLTTHRFGGLWCEISRSDHMDRTVLTTASDGNDHAVRTITDTTADTTADTSLAASGDEAHAPSDDALEKTDPQPNAQPQSGETVQDKTHAPLNASASGDEKKEPEARSAARLADDRIWNVALTYGQWVLRVEEGINIPREQVDGARYRRGGINEFCEAHKDATAETMAAFLADYESKNYGGSALANPKRMIERYNTWLAVQAARAIQAQVSLTGMHKALYEAQAARQAHSEALTAPQVAAMTIARVWEELQREYAAGNAVLIDKYKDKIEAQLKRDKDNEQQQKAVR